jgi:hypothetical protein
MVLPVFSAKALKSYDTDFNYEEIEKYLTYTANKYKDLTWTEDNIAEATTVKTELTGLRTSLKKAEDSVKEERYNAPKSRFMAKIAALQSIIGTVEKEIDEALNTEDQKRIDDLNEAFDAYIEHFVTIYSLQPEYAQKIERKKSYYNKTAKESETKKDLEAQAIALRDEQKRHDADVNLVKKTLEGYPEINEALMIGRLNRGESASELVEWITEEKARIDKVRAGGTDEETEEPESEPKSAAAATKVTTKTLLGHVNKKTFTSDFKGKTKTIVVEIEYPIDVGDALTGLFKDLLQYGIKTKAVK